MSDFTKVRKMAGGGLSPGWFGTILQLAFNLKGNSNNQGSDQASPLPDNTGTVLQEGNTTTTQNGQKEKMGVKGAMSNVGKTVGESIKNGGAGYNMLQGGMSMANQALNKDLNNSDGFNQVNSTLDGVASAVGMVNPVAGLIVKGVQTGLNVANRATAKETEDFSVDAKTQERMGGGYSGAYADMATALSKAGLKYGGFNRKGYNEATEEIDKAQQMQGTIQDIDAETRSRQAMAANVLQNTMRYNQKLSGGFDARYLRAAKAGVKLEHLNRLKTLKTKQFINLDTKQVEETNSDFNPVIIKSFFKEGGKFEEEWNPIIPSFRPGGKTKKDRSIEELIEYAKQQNPRFIQRLSEPPRGIEFIDDEGNLAKGSHYLGSYGEYVIPRIQEIDGNLKLLTHLEAFNHALETGNYLKMSPEEAILFAEQYKQGWPEFFKPSKQFPQEYIDFINSVKLVAPNLGELEPEGYNMYRYWELNGKPKNWDEALQKEMFHKQKDGYHAHSVAWNENGEGEWMKHKTFPTAWMEKAFYDGYEFLTDPETDEPLFFDRMPEYEGVHPILIPLRGEKAEESKKFRETYDLVEDENGNRKYVLKKTEKHKEGGSIKESEELVKLEETTQKNVIPEGALHKNKHHIENTKGLTLKGIPVIDNDGEQQAEIELDEIIFTLEVTKKLEELHKKYKEGNEQAAVEAGKLLVQEILYNTDDRTGLIAKCLKGGTL